MTQVVVALAGLVGILLPALLALPLGPRRRLAQIQHEAETYAALPDDMVVAKENLSERIETSTDEHLGLSHTGSPVFLTLQCYVGVVLVAIGVQAITAPSLEALAARAWGLGAALCIGWGLTFLTLGTLRFRTAIRYHGHGAKSSAEDLAKLRARLATVSEAEKELEDERNRIAGLRRRLQLIELRGHRLELEEQVRDAEEGQPAPEGRPLTTP